MLGCVGWSSSPKYTRVSRLEGSSRHSFVLKNSKRVSFGNYGQFHKTTKSLQDETTKHVFRSSFSKDTQRPQTLMQAWDQFYGKRQLPLFLESVLTWPTVKYSHTIGGDSNTKLLPTVSGITVSGSTVCDLTVQPSAGYNMLIGDQIENGICDCQREMLLQRFHQTQPLWENLRLKNVPLDWLSVSEDFFQWFTLVHAPDQDLQQLDRMFHIDFNNCQSIPSYDSFTSTALQCCYDSLGDFSLELQMYFRELQDGLDSPHSMERLAALLSSINFRQCVMSVLRVDSKGQTSTRALSNLLREGEFLVRESIWVPESSYDFCYPNNLKFKKAQLIRDFESWLEYYAQLNSKFWSVETNVPCKVRATRLSYSIDGTLECSGC